MVVDAQLTQYLVEERANGMRMPLGFRRVTSRRKMIMVWSQFRRNIT